jgi:tetratricopeptide (TPR) repeat protein
MIYAEKLDQAALAEVWLKISNAAASRVGADKVLEEQRLLAQGVIAAQSGHLEEAVAAHEQALAAATGAFGANNPALWASEQLLAASMEKAGNWVGARPHQEHALALREAAVGPNHPDVALILSNLGVCLAHVNDLKGARTAFQRAIGIREKTFGAKSPLLVPTLNNMADFALQSGDLEDALQMIVRAQAIAERVPGPTHAVYHTVATTHAQILAAMHRVVEARAAYDAVLELEVQAHSPELAETLAARGALELGDKKWADAVTFLDRSIAGYEAIGGKDHLDLWRPLADLAAAKRALDPKSDVRPLLERALALGVKARLPDGKLRPIREALATR